MRHLIPTLLTALCLATTQLGAGEAGDRKPTVIFIAVDDLNDSPACMDGAIRLKTPNIDRLAAMGMRFTRAYCPAPLCNPSRTALLTGVRPHVSGIYSNLPWFRQLPDLKDVVTLPQAFRQAGYTTATGGKIFHGSKNFRDGLYYDETSWDIDYGPGLGTRQPKQHHRFDFYEKLHGGYHRAALDWAPSGKRDKLGDRDNAIAAAKLLVEHDDGKPLFLALGIFRPHLSWYVPQEFFDAVPMDEALVPPVKPGDLDDVPAAGRAMSNGNATVLRDAGKLREAIHAYQAAATFADDCVGRVVEALEQSPRKNETIVVLWSDHGWHLGEKEHMGKVTLWERATRAPFIIVAPGVTEPGSVCDTPVSTMHLYATLCDLAGIAVPEHVQDGSLRPLLEDPAAPWDLPALMTRGCGNHALRDGRYRYIRYVDGSEELYDHETDPHEWTNLANDPAQAAVIEHLKRSLPAEDRPARDEEYTKLTGETDHWKSPRKKEGK